MHCVCSVHTLSAYILFRNMAEVKSPGTPIGAYAVALAAYHVEQHRLVISSGFANTNEADTKKVFLEHAMRKWPPSEGYANHLVSVTDIGYGAGKAIVGGMFEREDFKKEAVDVVAPILYEHFGEPAKKKRKRAR